ncbi:MAG: TonB-dependent receptor [Bacteroidales bacterium]
MQVSSNKTKPDTFTFKRWSRKSYGIFRSLGTVVHIAGLSLAIAANMMPKNAVAQDPDTNQTNEHIEMDEVVVSAQRNEVIYSEMARMVEVLDEDEIAQLPVQTIDELLNYAMNVDVRQRGGMNVQADVSIRAGSFDQVMILLNGVNITDPQTGHHNLNLPVDLSAVKRIEILSGPGSRIFGPNAFSGAINIITGTKNKPSLKAGVHAGEHGYAKATAVTSLETSRMNHFIAADYARSDGYIDNTDFALGSAFYQATWNPDKTHKLDFQAGYNQKQFGANSFYTPAYPEQFEETRTKFASLKYKFGNKNKWELKAYWRRHHDRFELFRNESPNWYQHHNYHMTDVGGVSANTVIPVSLGKISLGAEYRGEQIFSNVLGNKQSDTIEAPGEDNGFFTKYKYRGNFSAFAEYTVKWENLYIATGLMTNYNPEIQQKWKIFPGIDLNYKISRRLHAFATSSYGMRLPTFTDLYYESPTNIGNKNLKPEENTSVEAGIKVLRKKFMVRSSGFMRWGTNIIDWVKYDEQSTWQTKNLTSLNTKGFSIQSKLDLVKLFSQDIIQTASFDYSFARQEKETQADMSKYALDYLKHKANVKLTAELLPDLRLNTSISWQDRAGGFIMYENGEYGKEKQYEPFWLVDARITYHRENWNIYADVTNILDKIYYDIGNVPQPGRFLRLGVNMNITW